jgi:dihydrofolate reductase
MRRVIVNNIVSLDGFYADSAGNPIVLNMDEAFDQANLEDLEAADVVLLGRESFEGFSGYWPSIADAPEPDPVSPEARQYDDTNRAISRRWNAVQKVVVTNSTPVPESNAWHASTTAVSRDHVADWVTDARDRGDGSILILASHILWNGLLSLGQVDEMHIMVTPDVLTAGEPLFRVPARLELIEARTIERSSNVQLRYAVKR